ncbi:MAG: hypothetical protein QOE06_3219 [Thermoleophilaceae bacterium]|nr:hypothetical protein [Thermoleophilaceae bacterium]
MYAPGHPTNYSEPYQRPADHRVLRVAGASLAWVVAIVAVVAGVGWLYLLRGTGALAAGPKLAGALPLEELAGRGAQPLLRMAVAWIPAGFAMGAALALGTRLRPAWVAVSTALLSFLILGSTTTASEAVSRNELFTQHLRSSLTRAGLWAAVAFAVIGSLLAVAALGRGARGGRAGAASARGARGSSAA